MSIDSLIHQCPIQIGDVTTIPDLCITPLGSYDVVLGMDWLSGHSARVDCKQKMIEYIEDHASPRVILGVQRPISLRMISAMQLKWCMQKGCQLFSITISDREEDVGEKPSLDNYSIL